MSISKMTPLTRARVDVEIEKKSPIALFLAVIMISCAARAKSFSKDSLVRKYPFCKNSDNFQRCSWPGKFKLGTENTLSYKRKDSGQKM